MKLGECLSAFARVVSLKVTRYLHQIAMFLGVFVNSKKPGHQKDDIDFLIGDLLKQATTRTTDRVLMTNNNNKMQEHTSLREENVVETD